MAEGSKFRLMHTMVRVRDLDRSLDFYTRLLGMTLLRRMDFPEGRFTLAFVGYGPEDSHAVMELTHNWDQEGPYDLGTGYGHIALGVHDIYGVCKELEAAGARIPRRPAGADEAWDDPHRLRRRSRWVQDRADRPRHERLTVLGAINQDQEETG